jgi:hypothetical protein
MHDQMEQLLAEPIKRTQLRGRTIVLVIEALDECQKIAGVEGGPLIELLAQTLRHQPVKLLVTSRQENSLFNMFRSLPHVSLRLHEIGSVSVEADVWRILNAGFANIRRKHACDLGEHEWPTNSDLNTMVDLTGPLFIYAATVLRFVGDPRFLPDERLQQVLERGLVTSLDSSRPFLQIDSLYADVLEAATVDDNGCVDAELCQRIGALLCTIVLLEQPVSIYALAHLMGVSGNVRQIDSDVGALASVLIVSRKNASDRFSETVLTFHPSFRDFLVDSRRCSNERFLVNPAEHQHELLYRCLQLLNNNLRYDICGIQRPGRANTDVHDLSTRLEWSVPEAVRYACQFWPVHLVACGSLSQYVSAVLLEFCTNHLLHWIETLSLLGKLSSAAKHLPWIMAWCQVSIFPANLQAVPKGFNRIMSCTRLRCITFHCF